MTYVIQINQDKTVILQDEEGESDWYSQGYWERLPDPSEIQVKFDYYNTPLFVLPKGIEIEFPSFILSKEGYIYNPENPKQRIKIH